MAKDSKSSDIAVPAKEIGRPRIKVNWKAVDAMCLYSSTQEEIAAFLGLSVDTLDRASKRDNKCPFADYSGQKRKAANIRLRQLQWESATHGNITMQIWLGKQRLDQRDKQEIIQQHDPLADLLAEFKKAHERGYVPPAVPEVTEENQ
jgi:hypothetical protein